MDKLYKVSEVKLSYRNNQPQRIHVRTSADCYKVLINNWNKRELEHRESFKVLLLNQANIVLGIYTISVGGIAGSGFDARLILQAALLSNASTIVLAHNHPSGNLNPGYGDVEVTKLVQEAARVMTITVFDHIIVCRDTFFSFANKGML